MKNIASIIVLALFACLMLHASGEGPKLLVSKRVINDEIVKGSEVTVNIRIFNIGTGPALDLTMSDEAWDPSHFEYTVGLPYASWDRLGAGANISHSFVVTATESGYGRDQSAIVSYRSKPDGPESFVRSTNYQYIGVKGSGELAEAHNTFLKEWGVFVGLSAGAILLPTLYWLSLAGSYDRGVKIGSNLHSEVKSRK